MKLQSEIGLAESNLSKTIPGVILQLHAAHVNPQSFTLSQFIENVTGNDGDDVQAYFNYLIISGYATMINKAQEGEKKYSITNDKFQRLKNLEANQKEIASDIVLFTKLLDESKMALKLTNEHHRHLKSI